MAGTRSSCDPSSGPFPFVLLVFVFARVPEALFQLATQSSPVDLAVTRLTFQCVSAAVGAVPHSLFQLLISVIVVGVDNSFTSGPQPTLGIAKVGEEGIQGIYYAVAQGDGVGKGNRV